jgi:CO dehydrogenase maturation factor
MRVAVAGKGGVGKSVIAATMARILGRRGERVLAVNGDFMPGLPCSLGVSQASEAILAEAVENVGGKWQLRSGIGPVRAIKQFATVAPDGVRLLDAGDVLTGSRESLFASTAAFLEIVRRLDQTGTLRQWAIVGDYQAGHRTVAYDWAPFARTFLVVAEPTRKSALTAARIARIVRLDLRHTALVVANKASHADARFVEGIVEEQVFARIPEDAAVVDADRAGLAAIDHAPSSAAVLAIERIVDALAGGNLTPRRSQNRT